MTPQQSYFPPPMHNMNTIWRSQSRLVMTKQATLPGRCVKCNGPADTQLKRNLRWHHPALYLLIFAGALIYVIIAAVISKSAMIHVGLCDEHAAARKRDMVIAWVLVLVSFACFYFAVVADEMWLFLFGLVLFFGAVIYGIMKTRVVTPQKIDDHFVWLNGVNANYLHEFPEWRGVS